MEAVNGLRGRAGLQRRGNGHGAAGPRGERPVSPWGQRGGDRGVDDCSSDGTAARLAEYKPPPGTGKPCRFSWYRHERNRGKGAGAADRLRAGHGRRDRGPGRGPGVRPRRLSGAAGPDPRRQGRRGVRKPLPLGPASGAVLLALGRQQVPDDALQHIHGSQLVRHGDVLQGVHPSGQGASRHHLRTLRVRARVHRTGGADGRANLRGARSPTTGERTRRARRSAGGTASRRSGAS